MNATNTHAHTAHIYARADKLLARAHELGLSKRGKPLKRDQAVELVSAEEGFRNRHVMAAVLKSASVPAREHSVDASAEHIWRRLVHTQGWNEASQIIHLEGFIRDQGLMTDFSKYAKRAAADECTEAALCGEFADICDQVIGLLESHGYSVQNSDLSGFYWEDSNDEASEDFSSEDAAWFDLFCQLGRKSGLDGDAFSCLPSADQLKLVEQVLVNERKGAMSKATATLEKKWGFEHPHYDRADWQHDVSEGNSRLGYWEWVQHALEFNGGQSEHCAQCGIHRETEEGSETLCGICCTTAERHSVLIQELEPRFHRAIKGFLSPREQGHTMGAFRKAMGTQTAALQIQAFTEALRTSCLSAKLQASARAVFTEMIQNQANA